MLITFCSRTVDLMIISVKIESYWPAVNILDKEHTLNQSTDAKSVVST